MFYILILVCFSPDKCLYAESDEVYRTIELCETALPYRVSEVQFTIEINIPIPVSVAGQCKEMNSI